MIEERLSVIKADHQTVWLAPKQTTSCSKCASGQGCGASMWSRFFPLRRKPIEMSNTVQATVGDDVVIGITEQTVLASAFLVYVGPLFCMFLAAVLGSFFVSALAEEVSEFWVILFGFCGLFLGLAMARQLAQKRFEKTLSRPALIRVVPGC